MIVYILGIAGSGKGEAAAHLVNTYAFTEISLADPMKRFCKELFQFDDEQLWGPSPRRNSADMRYPREHGPFALGRCRCCDAHIIDIQREGSKCFLTPRYALQTLGGEWGRSCFQNAWTDMLIRKVRILETQEFSVYDPKLDVHYRQSPNWGPANCLVPDVRYKNELAALKAIGAKGFRLVRGSSGLAGSVGEHPSETEQREIPDEMLDAVIHNDGTLDELREKVSAFLQQVRI